MQNDFQKLIWKKGLIVSKKVNYRETKLINSLITFFRSRVIWERVHDFQLGIESYKIKINLTVPTLTFPGIEAHKPYSIVDKPSTGLICLNSKEVKQIMYLIEIVKFCDATLEKVLNEVKLKIFQSEPWRKSPLLGLKTLPTAEIFEQMDLMGYVITTDSLIQKGRILIEELDLDARISLVPPHAADQGRFDDTQISDQPEEQLGVFSATTTLADETRRRRSVENVQTYIRRRTEVSTGSGGVSTASRLVSTADISTASELDSTAGVKAKDKGKSIMQESEPPKKFKKRVQVKMSVDEELAKKVFEEEQARFNAEQEARLKEEQEQERIDFETALELQKQLDEREEVAAKVDEAHDIDWSDHAVLRYHTLQNRPFSVAEVRKNKCLYLKNQGGHKMSHFKGMNYEDIRPIFERVWVQNQAFIPMGSKIEKEKSLARKRARETLSEESAMKQKLEDDTEKEELQLFLNIVLEEESLDVESLATKYPIVD
ncbi:hypothetical protein Tco_0975963 [Tanacetum coccineum]|uniref:Uncharacterized protein n=1 Tax=Tanacetum coccineum TaxID=301880 RepID=A0ABQ5EFX5_9ASTR